jgi:hypothetical protein
MMRYGPTAFMILLAGAAVPLSGWAQSSNPLPPAKQAIQQQYDQRRAAAAQNPAPRNPDAPIPQWTVPPFPASVISQDCDAPLPAQAITITNCWYGIVDGVNTMAFAGIQAVPDTFNVGVVVILSLPGYPKDVTKTDVRMESHIGSVGIIGAENGALTLVSQNGHILRLSLVVNQITSTTGNPKPGDLNGDGTINIQDIEIMKRTLNTQAFGPNDPRDLNHDGKIDVRDARMQATLCTFSHCN